MILAAIGVLCGVASAWVFRRMTNWSALRSAGRSMWAHLMELRLYADEPALVWRAQMAVLRDNGRLFRLMLPSILILALPMGWLFYEAEALYGWEPLRVGDAAVVTAQLNRPLRDSDGQIRLETSPGIAVETPPVRIAADRQICWRIRPARAGAGELRLRLDGRMIRRTIAVGTRPCLPSPRRGALEVDYESNKTWMFWFFALSTVSALALAPVIRR